MPHSPYAAADSGLDDIIEAGRQVSESIIDARYKADGHDLARIIGERNAAERLREEACRSVLGRQPASAENYSLDLINPDAPMAARVMTSMLVLSGAKGVERTALPHSTDRKVKFCAEGAKLPDIARNMRRWAATFSEKRDEMAALFRASNVADQRRTQEGATKVLPLVFETGGIALGAAVQTNERNLAMALADSGFTPTQAPKFMSSDRREIRGGYEFRAQGAEMMRMLEIVSGVLSRRAIGNTEHETGHQPRVR